MHEHPPSGCVNHIYVYEFIQRYIHIHMTPEKKFLIRNKVERGKTHIE